MKVKSSLFQFWDPQISALCYAEGETACHQHPETPLYSIRSNEVLLEKVTEMNRTGLIQVTIP